MKACLFGFFALLPSMAHSYMCQDILGDSRIESLAKDVRCVARPKQASDLPRTIETDTSEPEVFQRESIATSADIHPFIQTSGVYTCVALIIYSRTDHRAVMAHIDTGTNIETEIKKLGLGFKWSEVEVSVVGGQPQDKSNLFQRVRSKVQELGGQICMSFQNENNRDLNLRLDLNTGEISTFGQKFMSTPSETARCKQDRIRRGGGQLFNYDALCSDMSKPDFSTF